MKPRNAFMLGLILILSMLGISALAGTGEQANNQVSADEQQFGDFDSPRTTDQQLVHLVNLWHDAILKDKQAEVNRYSKDIDDLLTRDLSSSRAALKQYAQQAVLQNAAREREGTNLMDADGIDAVEPVDREMLKRMISFVRTKEALIKSINRANAFSNKYRLLGDYVDLIRRELKLPRLKFALEENE